MTLSAPQRVRMFAGPNGSGKSTLAHDLSAAGLLHLYHFINADELYRSLREGQGLSVELPGLTLSLDDVRSFLAEAGRLRPDHPFFTSARMEGMYLTVPPSAVDVYVAASIADCFRERLMEAGQSFSFETVMSHPSKVDFLARARHAGYRTYLYFVALESAQINVRRVKERVKLGGHDVPEDKIIERYHRTLELVGEAMRHATRAFLFDNSGDDPLWLAELTPGGELQLKVTYDRLPTWFQLHVAPRYLRLP